MSSILLAYKHPQAENPAACHAGMGVTATNTAMALREDRIQADPRPVANGEFLWTKLANDWSGYTHVVMCAPYVDAAFLTKLVRNFPKTQFAMVYHSNLGFLSVDQFAARSLPLYLDLESQVTNFRVAANSPELAAGISGAGSRNMLCLPNVYHLPHFTRRTRAQWKPPIPLQVGLFGAARVLKNWLTAATGAMMLQRTANVPLNLHVNSGRDEGAEGSRAGVQALLPLNPNVRLVEVGWLSADDFRRYLYGMDLLLQPSFTETFNNVTADGISCGVPSVVSDAITWAPDSWKARADSAADIAAVAMRILRDKKAPYKGQAALDAHNQTALAAWKGWIGI